MTIHSWIGIIFVGQLIGFLPYHSLFGRTWIYWSIGTAFIGVILLLVGRNKSQDTYEDNGLYPNRDSEYSGSQVLNLLDQIEHHDE